ncbi:hypothetical protein PF007_g5957 [Phytophthora fragariae]|uniref:Uncharacterized protein n=1 Tax=Phytophthora fragariae TaxID=53985 RepID=A0A6A4ECX6_9STRA|nr:hypothetical protein PF003_g6343 [Phytophthora fragariae]KAE8942977.1 hypothetical protein PF009_g7283 [Phytophthora fragariae]KAE9018357.1 hypothetical protein PF011_g6305 [Phytophthora fragariae]KAE9126492.1 hypothetical protein PF007_g5957 [Phytophthora fragariae]KAE9151242.1 hypothetical protein PF006_g4446 [Phytophthora fragariae]
MGGRFWMFCRMHGDNKAQYFAWSRKGTCRAERQAKDDSFLRSRRGKELRHKYWQLPRPFNIDEEEDPRDEVEVLELCLRRSELEICGPPDSKLFKTPFRNRLGADQTGNVAM